MRPMIEKAAFVWSVNDAWAMLAALRVAGRIGCAIRVENKADIHDLSYDRTHRRCLKVIKPSCMIFGVDDRRVCAENP